eukprot:7855946-Alexandrium_andersonii.AAC.1
MQSELVPPATPPSQVPTQLPHPRSPWLRRHPPPARLRRRPVVVGAAWPPVCTHDPRYLRQA